MTEPTSADRQLLDSLLERAKELSTLYRVEALLSDAGQALDELLPKVVEAIPSGMQFPRSCEAHVSWREQSYATPGFALTPWAVSVDLVVHDAVVGQLTAAYRHEVPAADQAGFLAEEVQLLSSVANRLGQRLFFESLREVFDTGSTLAPSAARRDHGWQAAVELLRKVDQALLVRLGRKMMNHLLLRGVEEASELLRSFGEVVQSDRAMGEVNQAQPRSSLASLQQLCDRTFAVAAQRLADDEILACFDRWVNEDRCKFLTRAVATIHTPLNELSDAVDRYLQMAAAGTVMGAADNLGVRVELTRRFLGQQLELINIAKHYLEVEDFATILHRMVHTAGSVGSLGGKAAGVLLASKILERARVSCPEIGEVRTPRAWYVASDALFEFLAFNRLDDLYEHKYKPLDEIRQDFPHIVQVFKSSHCPHEMARGLAMLLDDLGDVPLVVRSSSLLEDRLGHPFAGKYRSLFVANQGSREQRFAALVDAIAEVYASVFGPDPIEYRAERGLLDFNEEMGILIQEVVGRRVGRYWLPAFAGVAFSRNEMRWSPRIRREDGLLRLVPGLGTRAVDRLTDDYPVLIAPGQPKLRVNLSADEVARYSPQWVDVVNLESNCFETKALGELLEEVGEAFPALDLVLSVAADGVLSRPVARTPGWWRDGVVTFDGLVERTPFVAQVRAILRTLEEALGTPVDIELASDGTALTLLQCRPQSWTRDDDPVEMPTGVAAADVVFSANRYVSDGRVPALSHIVYVVPERYAELASHDELRRVGTAVGRLNAALPRRRFVLMGPGRWGSRGDIKLGVRVTYSDINNTALLVEVARRRGSYVPDVSFGTHFFQDLVDSGIRYLPLYPDDAGVAFNHELLLGAPNLLPELVPELADLAPTVRVIDVAAATGGRLLHVVLDGDRDAALGYLAPPK